MALASHASTSALTAATREIPSSPFAQLLRQSRFATYDPLIRKTYTSPKQFVERGYWGVKRPLTMRKRNSFMTIRQWEARQHYTEWDNSEDETRFIRRIEELNIRPGQSANSKWAQTLGPAKNTWLVDSEFAPHPWDHPLEEPKESQRSKIALSSLGLRGEGGYGKDGLRRTRMGVIPNVTSMTPKQFERYLKKLRALRPAFADYIKRESESRAPGAAFLKEKSLAQIAQVPNTDHHRLFLAQHTETQYASTKRIQPQPHRAGGLLYSHPAPLDTFFHTSPKPGIVLSVRKDAGRYSTNQSMKDYLASFAGIAAVLPERQAQGKEPLLNPGVERERWPNAAVELRPTKFALNSVPHVVGPDYEGLTGVRVALQVTAHIDTANYENPYPPGSRMYAAHQGFGAAAPRGADIARGVGASAGPAVAQPGSARARFAAQRSLTNAPMPLKAAYPGSLPRAPISPVAVGILPNVQQQADNRKTLGMLSDLLNLGSRKGKGDDDPL
ncbi:hypothetical protein B0H15DRAFT_486324 [Mycena belliarum]|uniref:Uncharacterized protein n=1 Tax=Mycena belliarum TaxID=1033014 RepID=A0AAD6XK50_9AGAR|nr:hypothetical protein B0H15DRAFT_486324 [Mycena belliae]